jgi:hypothetical protein
MPPSAYGKISGTIMIELARVQNQICLVSGPTVRTSTNSACALHFGDLENRAPTPICSTYLALSLIFR